MDSNPHEHSTGQRTVLNIEDNLANAQLVEELLAVPPDAKIPVADIIIC